MTQDEAINLSACCDPISFFVPGLPIAKGRARFTKTGRAYTPARTTSYEAIVARFGGICADLHGLKEPWEGALAMNLEIVFPAPKGWTIKRREECKTVDVWHTARPDASNVTKAIEDALNGILYKDDSQISVLVVRKRYGIDPGVMVTVTRLHG